MKKKVLCILQLPPPNHGASFIGKMIKDSDVINSEFDLRYINSNLSTATNLIGKFTTKKISIYLNINFQSFISIDFF